MKPGKIIRGFVLTLTVMAAGTGAAFAANGLAKCKDGTTGIGPVEGAGKFCADHGGLEWWKAIDIVRPTGDPIPFGPAGKAVEATR